MTLDEAYVRGHWAVELDHKQGKPYTVSRWAKRNNVQYKRFAFVNSVIVFFKERGLEQVRKQLK